MTLTGIGGSLGVGTTLPTTTLDVLGDATFSGSVSIGATLSAGQLSVPSVATNVIGQLTGNVYATSGVSTFHKLDLNTNQFFELGQLQAEAIGIGTTMSNSSLVVNAATNSQFRISNGGNVSVKGDDPHGNPLYVNGDIACNRFLFVGNDGINANGASGAIDFSNAGKQATGAYANKTWMVPPTLTDTEKGSLTGITNGAFIYNSTSNKLEVYSGSSWTPLEANSGGGEVNQNAFSNIAVSGQNTVQADAKTDTVTFVAGSNMTITTSASGDEVTFASSGGGGGGGSSLQSRTTDVATTGSLASGAAANLNMTTAKSYVLQKIQTNYAAWVTVYTDGTSRTNDASRAETTDPLPGSGVIAEVITSGATTQILTPGVIGWNNDSTPSTNTYVKVVNKESSAYPIQVTLHYLKLED